MFWNWLKWAQIESFSDLLSEKTDFNGLNRRSILHTPDFFAKIVFYRFFTTDAG